MTDILHLPAFAMLGIVYGSFFEWALHKFVMHRPFLGLRYPFRTHGVTHHRTFGSGKDYHLIDERNRNLVTMAWWNAPVLFAINAPVGFAGVWLTGSWWALAGFMIAVTAYYAAYEYFHWCMHVPASRWFQRTRLFRWIDRHHRLHHLMPDRNLNVVLPLADLLLRTRIGRAPM